MNDQYLCIKVHISRNNTTQKGTVLRRKNNSNGTLIGTKNTNPILGTRVYEVGFPGESIYDLDTNITVENLFNSTLEDGEHHTYINHIVEIMSAENIISIDNGFFTTLSNNKRRVITTKGW